MGKQPHLMVRSDCGRDDEDDDLHGSFLRYAPEVLLPDGQGQRGVRRQQPRDRRLGHMMFHQFRRRYLKRIRRMNELILFIEHAYYISI